MAELRDIGERLVDFGAAIVKLLHRLPPSSSGKKIEDQMVRSAMSSDANYEEARGAGSLKQFDRWLSAVYPAASWQSVTDGQVEEHLDSFAALGSRPSRKRDALLVIRRFYRWLKLNQQVLHVPAEKLVPASHKSKRLVILAPSESRELIRFVRDEFPRGAGPRAASHLSPG